MKKKEENKVRVMFGSGEHAEFRKIEKGKKVMINGGSRIEAGKTLEEEQKRVEEKIDDLFYSKPVSLVRRLKRVIKK